LAVPLTLLRKTDERRYGSTLLLFYEHPIDPNDPTEATTPGTDPSHDAAE
jgi:hypothetical protein